MSLHPQVVQLLERAAKSPLPPYYEVPAHVARRIYRDTRAVLSPKPPEVAEARLVLAPGPVALRAYRPAGAKPEEPLPALPRRRLGVARGERPRRADRGAEPVVDARAHVPPP